MGTSAADGQAASEGFEPGGRVLAATRKELIRMRVTEDMSPALFVIALELAEKADDTRSARDLPPLTRELRATLEELAKVAPAKDEKADALDELAARRSGGSTAPAGRVRSVVRADAGA